MLDKIKKLLYDLVFTNDDFQIAQDMLEVDEIVAATFFVMFFEYFIIGQTEEFE